MYDSLRLAVLACACTFGLLACSASTPAPAGGANDGGGDGDGGPGGDDGGDDGGGATDEATESFVFVRGSMSVVDPLNPTSLIRVADDFDAIAPVYSGELNVGEGTLAQARIDAVYVALGSTLSLVDARIERSADGSAVAPSVVELSDVGEDIFTLGVDRDRRFEVSVDYVMAQTASGRLSIRVEDGVAEAPVVFPGVPIHSYFERGGDGWLTLVENELVQVSSNFVEITVTPATNARSLGETRDGTTFLDVDGHLLRLAPLDIEAGDPLFETITLDGDDLGDDYLASIDHEDDGLFVLGLDTLLNPSDARVFAVDGTGDAELLYTIEGIDAFDSIDFSVAARDALLVTYTDSASSTRTLEAVRRDGS